MGIQNNPPFNYQNRFDLEKKACDFAKCAVAVAVVQSLAKHVFGVENAFIIVGICYVASEVVKGIGNHMRIDGIIAHHNLMGRGNQ